MPFPQQQQYVYPQYAGYPVQPWDAQPVDVTPDTPLDDLLVEYGRTKPLADSYTHQAELHTARAAELKAAITAAVVREELERAQRDLGSPLSPQQRTLSDLLRVGTANYA